MKRRDEVHVLSSTVTAAAGMVALCGEGGGVDSVVHILKLLDRSAKAAVKK